MARDQRVHGFPLVVAFRPLGSLLAPAELGDDAAGNLRYSRSPRHGGGRDADPEAALDFGKQLDRREP